MPTAQAHKLCPHGIFVPGRMERYSQISRQIRAVFESFTPVVEPLSLDEAFLNLPARSGCSDRRWTPDGIEAREVHRQTGLVISSGIAPIKMAAKILSDMSKPDGLLMLAPEFVRPFLEPLPVNVCGVWTSHSRTPSYRGYPDNGDSGAYRYRRAREPLWIAGTHLAELAHGRDPRPVVGDWQRKSYGEENTFKHDQAVDATKLRTTLIAHGEALARRLRADQVRARTITLKLKLARWLRAKDVIR